MDIDIVSDRLVISRGIKGEVVRVEFVGEVFGYNKRFDFSKCIRDDFKFVILGVFNLVGVSDFVESFFLVSRFEFVIMVD